MTMFARRNYSAVSTIALLPILLAMAPVPANAAPGGHATIAAKVARNGVPAWAIRSADLEADPAVRFGRLPNGMRYALMHNEMPRGGGAIRFAFNVAHLEEADREKGVAHFLEHMAFNGSKAIPEGKLVPMLERLGLAFGADTNASTAIDRTTYKLDLPKVDAPTIDAGLLMMREIAGNLTIAQAAVVRERGIIQSEARVRNNVQRRQAASLLSTLLPGNRLGARIGITPEEVARTTAADIRNFYDGYYRPERATLVMVGDFDVAAMEQKIRARFADWRGRGPARASYVRPNPETPRPGIGLFSEPAVPEALSMQHVIAYEAPLNSVADERQELLKGIAGAALSNRLAVLSRSPESPIRGGRAGGAKLFRSAELYGIDISPKDGRWKEAMALAEQEMRQAAQYGFNRSEVDEAKANIATALANAAKQAAGRTSGSLAESLVNDSIDNSVSSSPAYQLALFTQLAPGIDGKAVSDAFKAAWKGGPTAIHLSTQTAVAGGQQAVAEVLRSSAAIAVTAPTEAVTKAFAYDSFGPAGTIVADRRIEADGVRAITFANGVQLNIKKTDFEPGQILFRMNVGSGIQSFPTNREGLSVMLPVLSGMDGLKAHDIDELRRIVAGHTVSLGLVGVEDAIVAQGGSTAKDLELQLKLLAAKIIASGYRPETQVSWASITPTVAKSIRSDAMQRFSTAAPTIIADGDARMGLLEPEALGKITLDDLKAAVEPQLQHGPIAIAIVGDVDEQAAIAAVAKTLGALPKRGPAMPAGAPVHFASDRSMKFVRHGGGADQGVVALIWPTTDDSDYKSEMRRELLAAILQLRLLDEIREKLAATYTPNAGSSASNTFKGFGSLNVAVPAQPATMDLVVKSIRTIAADLVAHPASADELLRARKPMIEAEQRDQRQNADWLGPVAKAQSVPDQLERHRTRTAVVSAITTADIQAEAQRWLVGEPLQIRSLPEGAK